MRNQNLMRNNKNGVGFLKSKLIILLLTLIVGLLGLSYLVRGFYVLTLHDLGGKDLYSRWQEQLYIYRGVFPYSAIQGSPLVEPDLGPIRSSGYLPWSFFAGFVLLPPISFEMLRWYHALLNFISLIVTAVFAYQIGKPYGRTEAWLTVSICLSFSSYSIALGNGQYGIIINALLIVMLWLLQRKQNILAGLFLGVALLKPTISGLYFFILVARRRVSTIVASCLYLMTSSLIIGIAVKASPVYMISNVLDVSKYYAHTGYSSINALLRLGISPMIAILCSIAIFSIITLSLFNKFKEHSLLFLFAIASLAGRLATYHLPYDNIMLIFLVLALVQLAFNIPSKSNIGILTLLVLSLVTPGRFVNLAFAQIVQISVWLTAAFYLLMNQKHFKDSYVISCSKDSESMI